MDVAGTEGIAEVNEGWVDEDCLLRTIEKVLKVFQVTVAAANAVPSAVLVENEYLARRKPTLHKQKATKVSTKVYNMATCKVNQPYTKTKRHKI